MNYYAVLGLSPDAADTDVKRAYKKLASKHHPDKGGDTEQFKKIQEAYEKITRGQGNQPEWKVYTDYEDFSQPSSQQRGPQHRNPDKIVTATIPLSKVNTGTDVLVETAGIREVVLIAPGSKTGDRIRLRGKGFSRFAGSPPGDLIVVVDVQCPPGVSVKDNDVYQRVEVSAIDAMIGDNVTITHYTGKTISVKIPAGTQSGAKLRLGGYGIPNPLSGAKGDLLLVISVIVPAISDPDIIESLRLLKQRGI